MASTHRPPNRAIRTHRGPFKDEYGVSLSRANAGAALVPQNASLARFADLTGHPDYYTICCKDAHAVKKDNFIFGEKDKKIKLSAQTNLQKKTSNGGGAGTNVLAPFS